MADLVTVSTGDVITASRANDVKTYIHDGTHLVNTLSLNIGGIEIIDSSGNITTNVGTIDGIDIGTDVAANTTKISYTAGAINGAGVPSSTPIYVGAIYVDTTNLKIYISTGTASSADWKKVLSQ